MWALVKENEVISIDALPSNVLTGNVSKKHLRYYQWVNITTDTGTPVVGDAYYNGKFIGPITTVVDGASELPYHKCISREDVKRTTSETPQLYTELETDDLATGYYRIAWTYGWNIDSTKYDFQAYVDHVDHNNTTTTMYTHVQEAKEAGGNWMSTGTNQQYRTGGFKTIQLSGINKFRLLFCTENSKDDVSMWDARVEVERVI